MCWAGALSMPPGRPTARRMSCSCIQMSSGRLRSRVRWFQPIRPKMPGAGAAGSVGGSASRASCRAVVWVRISVGDRAGDRSRRVTTPISVNWPIGPVTCGGLADVGRLLGPAGQQALQVRDVGGDRLDVPSGEVRRQRPRLVGQGVEEGGEVTDRLPPGLDVGRQPLGIAHAGDGNDDSATPDPDVHGDGQVAVRRRRRRPGPGRRSFAAALRHAQPDQADDSTCGASSTSWVITWMVVRPCCSATPAAAKAASSTSATSASDSKVRSSSRSSRVADGRLPSSRRARRSGASYAVRRPPPPPPAWRCRACRPRDSRRRSRELRLDVVDVGHVLDAGQRLPTRRPARTPRRRGPPPHSQRQVVAASARAARAADAGAHVSRLAPRGRSA